MVTDGSERVVRHQLWPSLLLKVVSRIPLPPPAAKKMYKASLILDLTRTATAHHVENMEFQRSHFEYQKETRLEDLARLNARDVREVDYRERLDVRDQERYETEQIRLAKEQNRLISAQNDARSMNEILGTFLTSISAKL